MGKLIVIDLEENQHELEAAEGLSVMEVIYDAGLPIKAACFGCCSCSTCHVYVDNDWIGKLSERTDEEEEVLDMVVDYQDNSRLCCQILYNNDLDGLRVTLAEDTKPD